MPLTWGSETMCHSGRQETEPQTRERNGAPSPVGPCNVSRLPCFPSAALSGFEEVPYLRGERGQRKPHVKNSKFSIRIQYK